MKKIKSDDITKFINYILTTPLKKSQFTDVWIDLPSMQELFVDFIGNNDILFRTFVQKLNFIAESKSHALHHKKLGTQHLR